MSMARLFDIFPEMVSFATGVVHPFFFLGCFALMISLVGGWAYKQLSDQEKLSTISRKIRLNLLVFRMPSRGMAEILRAQGRVVWHNLEYVSIAALPSLVVVVPVVLALFSFENYFAFKPVSIGDVVAVDVVLVGAPKETPRLVSVSNPEGLILLEKDPLLSRWVFRGKAEGDYTLVFQLGPQTFTKGIVISSHLARVAQTNSFSSWTDWIVGNGEIRLPHELRGIIQSVNVGYQPRQASLALFGWHMDWLSFFLLFSLVFVLFTKRLLHIQ